MSQVLDVWKRAVAWVKQWSSTLANKISQYLDSLQDAGLEPGKPLAKVRRQAVSEDWYVPFRVTIRQ